MYCLRCPSSDLPVEVDPAMRAAHTIAIIPNSDRALCPMSIIAILKYDEIDDGNWNISIVHII
jgi:hypothetical protein